MSLKDKVGKLEENVKTMTIESKDKEIVLASLNEGKKAAELELQSCKTDKEILVQKLKKGQHQRKSDSVARRRKKRPSPKLENDEIDDYKDNAKEDNRWEDAKSDQDMQNVHPKNGHYGKSLK